MNCKQGELAMVVGSQCNDGKIVRCLKFVGTARRPGEVLGPVVHSSGRPLTDLWETDVALDWVFYDGAIRMNYAPDKNLRPIRGDLLDKEEIKKIEVGDDYDLTNRFDVLDEVLR